MLFRSRRRFWGWFRRKPAEMPDPSADNDSPEPEAYPLVVKNRRPRVTGPVEDADDLYATAIHRLIRQASDEPNHCTVLYASQQHRNGHRTVLNLGKALAAAGKSVLLVDSDNEACLTRQLGAVGKAGLLDAIALQRIEQAGLRNLRILQHDAVEVLATMIPPAILGPADDTIQPITSDPARAAEIPPLRALRPDLPEELEQLIGALLAKDPARRPVSAEAAKARKIRETGFTRILQPGMSQRHDPAARLRRRNVVGLTNPVGCAGHGRLPRMLTSAPSTGDGRLLPKEGRQHSRPA